MEYTPFPERSRSERRPCRAPSWARRAPSLILLAVRAPIGIRIRCLRWTFQALTGDVGIGCQVRITSGVDAMGLALAHISLSLCPIIVLSRDA
eukprot:scaffold268683_cov33-Tisochrysis_lutea.AAC.2